MSFIAGIFLIFLDTFDAFVRFSNLIVAPSLIAFYSLDEKEISKRYQLHNNLFNTLLPKLYEHLVREAIFPKMYLFEWLFTLYSNVL
jgi:uncharacterized membrane protein